mmetsp:Transcript_57262/g.170360  ORF Transcript_57262/g.170360 Transcript_57262/m.170360 type:complete len:210 (-) Transcript_57262:1227-1856(-)
MLSTSLSRETATGSPACAPTFTRDAEPWKPRITALSNWPSPARASASSSGTFLVTEKLPRAPSFMTTLSRRSTSFPSTPSVSTSLNSPSSSELPSSPISLADLNTVAAMSRTWSSSFSSGRRTTVDTELPRLREAPTMRVMTQRRRMMLSRASIWLGPWKLNSHRRRELSNTSLLVLRSGLSRPPSHGRRASTSAPRAADGFASRRYGK